MTSKGTPTHGVRVPRPLWEAALDAAQRQGTNRNAVVVKALEDLVNADQLERQWREGLTARTDQGDTPA